eukprot:5242735-Alexandrium_andersonii.AAC.1
MDGHEGRYEPDAEGAKGPNPRSRPGHSLVWHTHTLRHEWQQCFADRDAFLFCGYHKEAEHCKG